MTITARTSDLRQAYATLVRHYHPDTSPETASPERLAVVQQLYRELSRPATRRSDLPYAQVDHRPRAVDVYA